MENAEQAESIAPQLIESMKTIVGEFAEIVANQSKFQEKLLAEIGQKKTITAKSSSGTTLTATIQ
jgi:hypothetical protein